MRTFRIILIAFSILAISGVAQRGDAYVSVYSTPTPSATPTPTATGSTTGSSGSVAASATPTVSALPTVTSSPGSSPATSPIGSELPDASPSSEPDTSIAPALPVMPVPPLPGVPPALVAAAADIGGVAAPVAATSTVVAILMILTAALQLSGTGVSLLNVIGFGVQSFWEIVGVKKKSRVWGTVYDAKTKRGIPYVHIELLDSVNRVLEVRYADADGRYGFLVNTKSLREEKIVVHIRPAVHGYRFPSTGVNASVTDFIVYDHVYTDGPLTIGADDIVNANVPMDPDPVSLGHTEFVPMIPAGHALSGGLNVMFWVGVIAAPVAYWMQPTPTNLVILVLFVFLNGFRMVTSLYRPFGFIRDASTGSPIPYALVELCDVSGKRITFSVSDERGRYFLIVAAGTYLVQLHTPANTIPVRVSTMTLTTRRGWIARTLTV